MSLGHERVLAAAWRLPVQKHGSAQHAAGDARLQPICLFLPLFLVCACVKEGRNKAICLGRPGTDSRKVLFLGNLKDFAGTFFPVRVRGAGLCFGQAIVVPQRPEQISPKQSISAALGAPLSLLPLFFLCTGATGERKQCLSLRHRAGLESSVFF